jgi:hypothetical protein
VKLAGLGVGLTALVAVVAWWGWGPGAIFAAAWFGLLATALQLVAVALLRPVLGAPFGALVRRWGIGMGLRLLGVALFAALVTINRELFPPLPSALGYVGVVVPLLFLETRLLK